jgi:hypothetical protein
VDGPEAAKAILDGYLAAAIPAQLDAIAADHQVDRTALRNPNLMPPVEVQKLSIDDFPALITVILDALSVDRVDPSLEDLETFTEPPTVAGVGYIVTYLARVFCFARGADYADTNAARFRYALALRMALLGQPGMRTNGKAYVDEASWRESFSDVERQAAGRTIGACYVEFRIRVAEDLRAAVGDWVETLEVIELTMPTATTETP